MQRNTVILTTLLLALALAAPPAVAGWKALGTHEPDTRFDKKDGFMWQTPNHAKDLKAYLNVVPIQRDAYANPNSAETGSRIMPPGNTGFDAFYGVWIDCNRDGYIGSIETALIEYPTALLRGDESLCPSYPHRDSSIHALFHQQGWVTELVWIANGNATSSSYDGRNSGDEPRCGGKCDPTTADGGLPGRDGRVLRDRTVIDIWQGTLISPGANVWGDFGFPNNTQNREICQQQMPRTTLHSTGGVLNWADCFTGHNVWRAANPVLAQAGMGFSEPYDWAEPGHPLNVGTFGKDDASQTMLQAWDCRAETHVKVANGYQGVGSKEDPAVEVSKGRDSTGTEHFLQFWVQLADNDGHLNVSAHRFDTAAHPDHQTFLVGTEEAPSAFPPNLNAQPRDGSVAGTWNHTTDGATGDCDPSNGSGSVYFLESQALPEKSVGKNRVTLRFHYYEEQRIGQKPCINCQSPATGAPQHGTFVYPVVRGDVGSKAFVQGSPEGTHWYSGAAPSELGPDGPQHPVLVRSDSFAPMGGVYWTFYANMTNKITDRGVLLPSAPGAYGQEWKVGCGTTFKGTIKGFVCDPNQWYRGRDGIMQDAATWFPRPGNPFHLRDVDCYDGQVVAGVPVYASAALLADPQDFDGYGGVCKT